MSRQCSRARWALALAMTWLMAGAWGATPVSISINTATQFVEAVGSYLAEQAPANTAWTQLIFAPQSNFINISGVPFPANSGSTPPKGTTLELIGQNEPYETRLSFGMRSNLTNVYGGSTEPSKLVWQVRAAIYF